MRRPLRLTPLLLLPVVGLTLMGCSGDSEPSTTPTTAAVQVSTTLRPSTTTSTTSTPSTSSTTAPTSTTTNTDAEVLTAVRAFWDVFIEVGGRTGPFDPQAVRTRLAERTTGASTTTLFQFFQGNAAAGYVVRGEIDLAPVVVSNDGTTAQVRDCHDDRTGVYRAADGTRVDTDNPARHQVLMTLRKENGVWKVATIVDEGDGCVAS